MEWSNQYSHVVVDAWELARTTMDQLQRTADPDETWVFATIGGSDEVLAFDRPSTRGGSEPVPAIMYPELASRLWAWWITHAWRSSELALDAIDAIERWSVASSSVIARALLEEIASLSFEAERIWRSWAQAKLVGPGMDRPTEVRKLLHMPLLKAFRGTRLSGAPEAMKAVNILTMIERLGKTTGNAHIPDWYEWLSEASHPAVAAPLVYASPLHIHKSGAVREAIYALGPQVVTSPGGERGINDLIPLSAECVLECVRIFLKIGPQIEAMVLDFERTTEARALTTAKFVRGHTLQPDVARLLGEMSHRWGETATPLAWS